VDQRRFRAYAQWIGEATAIPNSSISGHDEVSGTEGVFMVNAVSQVRAALGRMIDQGTVRDVRSAGFSGFSDFAPPEPILDKIRVITVAGREPQTHWGEIYDLIQDAGVTGVLWGLEPASH
jgi:hypothetical protein